MVQGLYVSELTEWCAVQPYKPSDEFLIGNQPYRGQRIFTVSR